MNDPAGAGGNLVRPGRRRARTVVVVHDDALVLARLTLTLAAAGFRVRTARDTGEALARVRSTGPDAVVVPARTPGLDGIELRRQVGREVPPAALPVILLSEGANRMKLRPGAPISEQVAGSTDDLRPVIDVLTRLPVRGQ